MKQIYLSLGSNLGNRKQMLEAAKDLIVGQAGDCIAESKIYESPAWGYRGADYLNTALEIHSTLSAKELFRITQAIEKTLGRLKKTKYNTEGKAVYSARCIDIDILYYEQEIIKSPKLTIPHPRIQERNFVLFPLCDIAPDFVHPQLHKTNQRLKEELPEDSKKSIGEYRGY
jgi:2-amino-4-hydroxy-6-hydroxymethyldihydropteridine diphosphokinase